MFDKSAIQAIQESSGINAAVNAVELALQGNDAVALPDSFAVHDLENFRPNRRRARGTMSTSVVESFFKYTKEHKENGASIFVNPDDMTATTVLNFGNPDKAGHCDNLAQLKLKKTAAYVALITHATGQRLTQTQAAEFFEDWVGVVDVVEFFGDDGGVIESKKAIAALRKLTIESMHKLEASEQKLGATRSTFESVQASSSESAPTNVMMSFKAYESLEPREFNLRLSIITGGDKPAITLRIQNHELHQEQMAKELERIIAAEFKGTEIPVFLGTYNKK